MVQVVSAFRRLRRFGGATDGSADCAHDRMRVAHVVVAFSSRPRNFVLRALAAASVPPIMNARRTSTSVSWSTKNIHVGRKKG